MIVAAALCPCPPLLAAELTGQADILPELRAACGAAVASLLTAGPVRDYLTEAAPLLTWPRPPAQGGRPAGDAEHGMRQREDGRPAEPDQQRCPPGRIDQQ